MFLKEMQGVHVTFDEGKVIFEDYGNFDGYSNADIFMYKINEVFDRVGDNVDYHNSLYLLILEAIKLPISEWNNEFAAYIVEITNQCGLEGLVQTLSKESDFSFDNNCIVRYDRPLTMKDFDLLRKSIMISFSFQHKQIIDFMSKSLIKQQD